MRQLLTILLLLVSTGLYAQQNKRHVFLGWYSYLNGSEQRLLFWEPLDDIYLFPDSTVKATIYTDSTQTFSHVNLHAVGQTFASNSFLYVDPLPLPYFCSYKIDTIGFYYRYNHLIPGSVDTLRVQIFHNENVTRQQNSNPWYATVAYNSSTNLAPAHVPTFTVDILLDETYHTGLNINDTQFLKIIVPDNGMRVKQKKSAAFIATFIPGYNYAAGDTLQADDAVTPQNKLNGFLPVLYRDTTKYVDTTANNGLFAFKELKYRLSNNLPDSIFTPGSIFNKTNWVLDAQFHVTENICGPNKVEQVNPLPFKVYPNPANEVLFIKFDTDLTEFNLTITDPTGRIVKKESNVSSVTISNLSNGLYYLHISQPNGNYYAVPVIINH